MDYERKNNEHEHSKMSDELRALMEEAAREQESPENPLTSEPEVDEIFGRISRGEDPTGQ